MNNPTESQPKHLDATKPGVVPASQTSKPALVSTSQLPHDPMMRELIQDNSTKSTKNHKKPDLQPSITKTEVEAEQAKQPENKKIDDDQDLPKNVIEKKDPIVDQYDQKIQNLIEEKTYNLPIKSEKSKLLFGFLIGLLSMAIAGGILFVIMKS